MLTAFPRVHTHSEIDILNPHRARKIGQLLLYAPFGLACMMADTEHRTTMSSAAAASARRWTRLYCPRLNHIRLLSQKRCYQDVTFMWARKNQDAARACLKVPPITQVDSFTTLQEYYQCRNWDFGSVRDDENELKWAQRLVSHVLSAPMTFSHHYPSVAKQRVCVVGARAEATLPVEYWKEILVSNNNTTTPLSWTLDFCGPEVLTTSNNVTLKNGNDSLTLHWTHTGYLHDMVNPPEWDGFVLYNPGLGHDHLREGWLPTVEYLFNARKPILLTAHSKRDAERDAKLLHEITGRPIDYQPNAFASLITYEDPLSQEPHQVSPNSFVTLLQQ